MKSQSHGNACSDKDLRGSWGIESREPKPYCFQRSPTTENIYIYIYIWIYSRQRVTGKYSSFVEILQAWKLQLTSIKVETWATAQQISLLQGF